MAGDLIPGLTQFLAPHAVLLLAAVTLDLAIGDPVYPLHPIRLIGATLNVFEKGLRRTGANGYGGGIALFFLLSLFWIAAVTGIMAACIFSAPSAAWAFHIFVLYSLIAMGDLIGHVMRVDRAAIRGDLPAARIAAGQLVGRDTEPMDAAACRRAAIESLSESLTDGFLSPVFWYAVFGLPGLVVFKVVSTMDSMIGNRTPRYLRFGRCGARMDDAMNYLPARASLVLISSLAFVVPGCSAAKAWRVGLAQNRLLPSPNSGWSEAATAGAIQRRLVGPIWLHGLLVTDIWLGEASDPPASTHDDVRRALILIAATGIAATALAALSLALAGKF